MRDLLAAPQHPRLSHLHRPNVVVWLSLLRPKAAFRLSLPLPLGEGWGEGRPS